MKAPIGEYLSLLFEEVVKHEILSSSTWCVWHGWKYLIFDFVQERLAGAERVKWAVHLY
jgi:hypothetical protein